MFNLQFIDHVAILVYDMEKSITWYQQALGLEPFKVPEWGKQPVMMKSGDFAVALFYAESTLSGSSAGLDAIRIDHFAFRVTKGSFQEAITHFKSLAIPYEIKDHHIFHSVYIQDPNGHTIELTVPVSQAT